MIKGGIQCSVVLASVALSQSYALEPQYEIFSENFNTPDSSYLKNSYGDDSDWLWASTQGTPSVDTGPSSGSPSPGEDTGGFMYFETSYGYAYDKGDTAAFEIKDLNLLGQSERYLLKFDYHMKGSNLGYLEIEGYSAEYGWTTIAGFSNPDGNWHSTQVVISGTYGSGPDPFSKYATTKLRFLATASGGWQGDIAIDNVKLYSDQGKLELHSDTLSIHTEFNHLDNFEGRPYWEQLTNYYSDPSLSSNYRRENLLDIVKDSQGKEVKFLPVYATEIGQGKVNRESRDGPYILGGIHFEEHPDDRNFDAYNIFDEHSDYSEKQDMNAFPWWRDSYSMWESIAAPGRDPNSAISETFEFPMKVCVSESLCSIFKLKLRIDPPTLDNYNGQRTVSLGDNYNSWSFTPNQNRSLNSTGNWKVRTGQTPSVNTGPLSGISYNGLGGDYIYVETSSGYSYNKGDESTLEWSADQHSQCEGQNSSVKDLLVWFDYFMYGSNVGTLQFQILPKGYTEYQNVWAVHFQQQSSMNDPWRSARIDLRGWGDIEKVRFKHTADGGWKGDVALDQFDLSYNYGSNCF